MFCSPEYTRNESLRLSKVLDDIGVNERLITKRRKIVLTEETMKTITEQVQGTNVSMYHFGSRSEGTTTSGLCPDTDTLICSNRFNIIQNIRQWKRGFVNLLMVRDENTPHGYCMLQKTYDNVPEPVDWTPNNDYVIDRKGRVLMKNACFFEEIPATKTRQGPSLSTRGKHGCADDDHVHAFYCESWPKEAEPWLQKQTVGNWPSEEMKRQSVSDGCFVVPVGRHGTEGEELQWRVSTSLTERKLMFSLNISQIRCYVLMKMILKSNPILVSENALTSFICKTVLIHCIESKQADFWQENNLLSCLNFCLNFLYNCISFEHCPHFIIEKNNLMEGRFLPEIKQQLLDIIQRFILSNGRALQEIEIDQLGTRLSGQHQCVYPEYCTVVNLQPTSAIDIYQGTLGNELHTLMIALSAGNASFLTQCNSETSVCVLPQYIEKIAGIYLEGNDFEQTACKLITPHLCTSLGSVLASRGISANRTIPQQALALLLQGSPAGISSSLKRASMFYCTGDMAQTRYILEQTEEKYNIESVQSVCCCYQYKSLPNKEFLEVSARGDLEHVMNITGFCVRYLPCEVNCIPEELQHELFRLELDSQLCRELHKDWLNWAAVDSLTLFYFLKYKVYSNLGDQEERQRALDNLSRTTDSNINLGHRETALNLLGQCMEQENKLDDALHCYTQSTNLRPIHNAANFHTIQVLHKINNGQ